MAVVLIAIQYNFPPTVYQQHMDTREELKYPASSWLCGIGSELSGKCFFVLLQRLSNTILQGSIDQKTYCHNHHQYRDALWRLQKQRIRHKPGVF